ncbi:MAG TPA: amidase [Thermoanaerobaculia bacterium]|nr:amidase [Thermoanaerobaculia bacterium]
MPVSRRLFIGATAAAAAATSLPLSAHDPKAPRPASVTPGVRPFELEEVPIAELQASMHSGRRTSKQLVALYLERIAEVDDRRGAVALNSVLELNPDAMLIAEELDRERSDGKVRGPLHGIPIVIKDNIDTADRMRTSAGSLALAGSVAARDAHIVERLRAAGAVLLGKTNLSEWANFRSTRSSSGWSGRGGQTRNPYALDRNPCGSSSGSGAATAASLAAAAIGTETDGSVVCPSTANGLVGIKPTVGLVSRSGIIPISHTQDTAGPMARTVADAAALLSAIAGSDPKDEATGDAARHIEADYTRFLDPDGLKGARIGVYRSVFPSSPQVRERMESAIEAIRSLGATIVDPANIPTHGKFDEDEFTVLLYEFKADLNAYLAGLPPSVKTRTLSDLIAFNREHAREEMPYFGQELFEMAQAKGPLTDKEYREALERGPRLAGKEGIDAILAKEKLDAMIAPTGAPAWMTDLVNGDHYGGGYSSASAVSGYPHITVPMGFVFGLPVGISFFAGAWSEAKLIRYAYAFEQGTRARRPPRFLPTADLSISDPAVEPEKVAVVAAVKEHCGM